MRQIKSSVAEPIEIWLTFFEESLDGQGQRNASEEAGTTTEATTAATVRRGLGRRGHLFIGRTALNRRRQAARLKTLTSARDTQIRTKIDLKSQP
jgi:hypothetical protein